MIVKSVRGYWSYLLGKLNVLGAVLLAYAIANPGVMSELKALLPVSLQPFAPTLALGWFALVQYAKARLIAKERAKAK